MLRNELNQSFEPGLESAYAVVVPSLKEAMAKRILKKLGKAAGAGRMPPGPRRPRSGTRTRIGKATEARIREIIEEWPHERIDWGDVVAVANREFKASWRRQSLATHKKILSAFQDKKIELKKARPKLSGNVTIDYYERTVRQLTEENVMLKTKLRETAARMARWRHNAYLHRMTLEQLDEPMQENDRGRSDI